MARLLAISRDEDWTGWCQFFLEALIHQAEENTVKARAIMDLYSANKAQADFTHQAGIPTPTAQKLLKVLRDLLNIAEGRQAF